jgi:outer membrane protein assembly factor BamB
MMSGMTSFALMVGVLVSAGTAREDLPAAGTEDSPRTLIAAANVGQGRFASAPAEVGEHLSNPQRTGSTASDLKPPYRLLWVYSDPRKPRPAWKEPVWEPQRIDFDYAYAVSADHRLVYFASSADHALHALDLQTGEPRWKFFTEGPVRLAPALAGKNILFGSDDGFVYCLDAATGFLVWRYRPDLPDDRLLGNEQMISRWPARSGVLVENGRAYTTFGMLPPEGVCVCCLDAASGSVLWRNDTSGIKYMARPHVPGMGGVSPQGYLALCGDTLVVPCGRATPAFFDKHTGRLLYHECEGDFTGGAWAMAAGDFVLTPCETLVKEYGSQLRRETNAVEAEPFATASLVALHPRTGRELFTLRGGRKAVLSGDGMLTLLGPKELVSVRLADLVAAIGKESTVSHTTGHFVSASDHQVARSESGIVYSLLRAGSTLIAGGRGRLACFDATSGARLWETPVEGQARAMCLAPGHLVVSTTEGKIYCFQPAGAAPGGEPRRTAPPITAMNTGAAARETARSILAASGVGSGYCLVLGQADAAIIAELAAQSKLVIYHVASPREAPDLRKTLDGAGLYGTRVAVHTCSTHPLPYADYFADLVVLNAASPGALEELPAEELVRVLRPCGGVAVIRHPGSLAPAMDAWLSRLGDSGVVALKTEELQGSFRPLPTQEPGLPHRSFRTPAGEGQGVRAAWHPIAGGTLLRRGPIEGAGQWTHQYADPGKSAASADQIVRLPLKALWFGGMGPEKIVSRHFREPAPLVIDGRCFVPGTDDLVAMDIYNGRILWQRHLPDLAHWPAAYRGPSLAADHRAVYALQGTSCLCLDPHTGRTLDVLKAPLGELARVFEAEPALPSKPATSQRRKGLSPSPGLDGTIWEYLAVTDRQIIGSVGQANIKQEWWSKAYPANQAVFAFDKATKTVQWVYRAQEAIDSNAIAVDGDRLYLIDGLSRYAWIRRGDPKDAIRGARTLKALDLASGKTVWESKDVSPTQNSLWTSDGVLLSTINPFSRAMEDPKMVQAGGGVTAYAAGNGARLWKLDDVPTCTPVIVGGVLYLPQAYDLHSGKPIQIENQISGQIEDFAPLMPKACSALSGSPNLLMTRSGSLGFYDSRGRSGYYHYPIVRASCWINMIPAGGVVMVPEGSSSCVCAYNYKTSMAFVPADRRNFYGIARASHQGEVVSLRINFGAPGDRQDDEGHTWFAWPRPTAHGRPLAKASYGPKIGGGQLPIDDLSAKDAWDVVARNPDWTPIAKTREPWLYACGLEGPLKLCVRLSDEPAGTALRTYRVVLYFCDLEPPGPPRSFDVKLQGKTVLSRFEIAKEAGGNATALAKQFRVDARGRLELELVAPPADGSRPVICAMSIVKVADGAR